MATAVAAPASAGVGTSDDGADVASVELLDDAIDALSDGDGPTYDRLVDQAIDGAVWLPDVAVVALIDREVTDIVLWSQILDSADEELPSWAYAAVDVEREALAAIPLDGTPSTADEADDIEYADDLGAALLELLDRRRIDVPDTARSVLEPLDASIPDDSVYLTALDELIAIDDVSIDGDLDGTITSDDLASPQTQTADEITPQTEAAASDPSASDSSPEASPDSSPELTSDVSADARGAEVTTPTPASPPDDVTAGRGASSASSGTSPILLLAPMGLAVIAIAVGLVAMLRGRRHDRLADYAFTDGLTGLKNRRRMDADVAEQVTRSQDTATLMIDVDHFKQFNDRHGHAMGDEVLRLVGATLSREFRKTDVPYRYGGEEFCVLLPDTTRDEALTAGERIRAAIADIDLPIDERVTASIGVSIGPASAITETIGRADSALYVAKGNGRNQVAAL